MSQVDRDEFASRFDVGVPLDASNNKNDRVVLLYNHKDSLPNGKALAEKVKGNEDIPLLDIPEATENCDILNLVLIQTNAKRQCFAMMGQCKSSF